MRIYNITNNTLSLKMQYITNTTSSFIKVAYSPANSGLLVGFFNSIGLYSFTVENDTIALA
jgi:hypothetical protein